MTKIKDYTEDVNISDNDILLGSDKDNVSKTKNYKIGRLKDYILSFVETVENPQEGNGTEAYKSYVAWISQSGTNNPVITEIYNTIGPITWVRSSAGNYTGTAAANTFPSAKTFFPQKQFCRASEPGFIRNIYMNAGLGNLIIINQNDGTTGVDNLNWQFEIRVYN